MGPLAVLAAESDGTIVDLAQVFAAIPDDVVEICRRLEVHGKQGWVVGGCVRDVLRGATAKDWDIATSARPEEVSGLFRRVIPTGIDHGTVTVVLHGQPYEVTTLRGEGEYRDGRRPEAVVFLEDITQDLARRDFTINAIALDPLERALIDPFGGMADLEARVLRAVGDPIARFTEDGLRILRGARFSATLECEVEPRTQAAMADRRALSTYAKVSVERIAAEWHKAMLARRPSVAFELMRSTGMLAITCPELAALAEPGPSFADTMRALDATEGDSTLRLATLLSSLSVAQADAVARRLKLSNDERKRIVDVVRHGVPSYTVSWSDADVRRWARQVTVDRIDDVCSLARARGAPSVAELRLRCHAELEAGAAMTTRDLAIDGKTLLRELGLEPGPAVGELLAGLLDVVTDDPSANTPEALLAHARRLLEHRRARGRDMAPGAPPD